jgi:hypothetical protein
LKASDEGLALMAASKASMVTRSNPFILSLARPSGS